MSRGSKNSTFKKKDAGVDPDDVLRRILNTPPDPKQKAKAKRKKKPAK